MQNLQWKNERGNLFLIMMRHVEENYKESDGVCRLVGLILQRLTKPIRKCQWKLISGVLGGGGMEEKRRVVLKGNCILKVKKTSAFFSFGVIVLISFKPLRL